MPNAHKRISQYKRLISELILRWVLKSIMTKPRDNNSLVRYYIVRGRILLYLGQYDQAVSDFRAALQLDWRHEQAASWLDKARRAGQHLNERVCYVNSRVEAIRQSANPPSTRWMWPVV